MYVFGRRKLFEFLIAIFVVLRVWVGFTIMDAQLVGHGHYPFKVYPRTEDTILRAQSSHLQPTQKKGGSHASIGSQRLSQLVQL